MSGHYLVEAVGLGFSRPIFMPQERSIMSNPLSLLADFYPGGHERHIKEVLSDIDFVLRPGDRVGMIGHNGAGKSTLLRLVGGVYQPTKGKLAVNCQPQGLFDISLGFVPDATGVENIYLRGLEMGLTMKAIREKISGIIEFSGLSQNIDKPFTTYSAGMRLRLAVAIALSSQPDVMLLDEWIGAGDATFQTKVTARMNELVDGARALMLASHNDSLLKRVCTLGMVMHQGKCVYQGPIVDALAHYHKHIGTPQAAAPVSVDVSEPAPDKGARA